MKLKLDDAGNVVVVDGKPVYVDAEGVDVEVDVPMLFAKVKELNDESGTQRRKAKDTKKLYDDLKKKLDGIDDADDLDAWLASASEALETVKDLSKKDLVSA